MKKPRTALGQTHDERMQDFAGKKLDELLSFDQFRYSKSGQTTKKASQKKNAARNFSAFGRE